MQVALLTEGTYPVVTGGVSTWCDQLVRGLSEHQFQVVALTSTGSETPLWDLPDNVARMRLHPMWGPAARPLTGIGGVSRRRAALQETEAGLAQLWHAALSPDGPAARDEAGEALKRLAAVSRVARLSQALASINTVRPLMDAVARHGLGEARSLLVGEAVMAAALVDRTVAVLDASPGEVELIHSSGLGPSALVGLGAHWATSAPLLLSEHGVYLRERYLALRTAGLTLPVRRCVMAVLRRICEVAYQYARFVLPVNRWNARWETRLGAPAERVRPIPNGVDPARFLPIEDEPDVPTISFVGRIDPLKDLETLIRAFALVRCELPQALLRIFGPVPAGNEGYQARLERVAHELGVEDALTWEGPSAGSRPAFEAGHVVALSSISEGLPFTVIEAMMCGRPTVSTDVGGVGECLDRAQRTGRLVPPRDPQAFADACVALLRDREERRRMGSEARRRALSTFSLSRCIEEYRSVYAEVLQGSRAAQPFTPAGSWSRLVAV